MEFKTEQLNTFVPFDEINFTPTYSSGDYATILKSLDPLSPATFGGFSYRRPNEVTLCAEQIVDATIVHADPSGVDMYIKQELARKLAEKMIEEDLITIETDSDISTLDYKVRAKVKLIQE